MLSCKEMKNACVFPCKQLDVFTAGKGAAGTRRAAVTLFVPFSAKHYSGYVAASG